MRRRRLLATLAGAGLAGVTGLAGCLAPADGDGDGDAGAGAGADSAPATDRTTAAPFDPSLAAQGFPPTVCEEEPKPGGIRAVVAPAFGPDWAGVDVAGRYAAGDAVTPGGDLADDAVVVGLLTADDRARAYPLAVLAVHEVVNDAFGGPVAVTYCPLCRSGVVFDRRVRGEATTFGVSGLLWQPPAIRVRAAEQGGATFGASAGDPDAAVRVQGNLVMTDAATGSYWSQVLASAICGPLTGTDLALRPASVTTWDAWREEHPGTAVLLPPPASGLD